MWSSYTYCAMSCDPHTHTKITWSMSCDLHIHTQITCVMSNDLHTHTQITWSMSCDLHRHTQITCVMSCDLHTHTQITKLSQFLLLLNIGKDQLRSSHVLAWCSIQLSLLIYTKNLKLILCFNKKISIIFINVFLHFLILYLFSKNVIFRFIKKTNYVKYLFSCTIFPNTWEKKKKKKKLLKFLFY